MRKKQQRLSAPGPGAGRCPSCVIMPLRHCEADEVSRSNLKNGIASSPSAPRNDIVTQSGPPPGRRGFTLIELLVSVSIFAAVGAVLYSSFRGGVISWRRINSELAVQQKIRLTLDRISRDFRNAVFLSNLPFEGSPDRVKFVSLAESAAGQGINIASISYYLSPDEEGAIIREEMPIKNALSLEGSEEGPEDKQAAEAGPQKKQTLLTGVAGLKLEYLAAHKGAGGDKEIEYEWLDFWEEKKALPMGIKIELTLINSEDTSELSLSKRIYIPTAKPTEKTGQED